MSGGERALRDAVVEAARALARMGLNKGSAGNVSARWGEGFLVTPTGMDYERIGGAHIVTMRLDGSWDGALAPSSEWRFHRDIYANRSEAGAVIHCHSPFATALACQGKDIPPFHYMIARFGGRDVRCARYATFGTQALSDEALRAMEGRCACLLGHHGMLVFGADLERALALAVELETLCEQYWRTALLGPPPLLDDAEMDRVLKKFGSYGQQPARGEG